MLRSIARRSVRSVFVAVILVASLAGAALAQEMMTPSVTVEDQPIEMGTVTVAEVVSDGPGWIVIHADADGSPGPVIGYAAVADGTNTDVAVEIDPAAATSTLYAMLHTDAGEEGTYEFPGADGPVSVDGSVVTPAFMVTGGMMEEMEETTDGEMAQQEEGEAEMLPETGAPLALWLPLSLAILGLGILALGIFTRRETVKEE